MTPLDTCAPLCILRHMKTKKTKKRTYRLVVLLSSEERRPLVEEAKKRGLPLAIVARERLRGDG